MYITFEINWKHKIVVKTENVIHKNIYKDMT